LDAIAKETGRTIPQIAINWLLQRPTVSSVILGARTEAQLRDNLGAVDWQLTSEQIARLDAASAVIPPYPYFPYRRQEGFARLSPPAA
jgi:aryl-alcohol dehydrogenase-like predicted oxidoreductase